LRRILLGVNRPYSTKVLRGVRLSFTTTLLICSSFPAWLIPKDSLATPSSGTEQKQIRQIETDLSREKEQFLKLGLRERDLLGQLAAIEKRISEQRKILQKIKEKLQLNRKALERQREKLGHLERSSKDVRQRLSKRLTAFYKYGKRGYVHILTTSQDVEQLRRRMKYLQVIMEGDQELLQQLAEVEQEISQEATLIEERVAIIDGMKKAESVRLLSIKEEQDKKVFLLMKVHSEKEFYETLVKELQHASQNLKVTLLDLDRKQKKKTTLPSDFANSKGKLALPFNGKIIKRHDQWGVDIVKLHKGIFIQGPFGSKVRAVFAGRVDFSGWLKGYGQTIVINHGSRFFTVSAYLSERFMEEGDMVEEGTVIGLLGHTGPLEKPRLYFEIRRAGTPLNPLKWVKVN
jgi:septal ring factor EnvC (AmiA/AmiB activator)